MKTNDFFVTATFGLSESCWWVEIRDEKGED
jgi:hypothetical protein